MNTLLRMIFLAMGGWVSAAGAPPDSVAGYVDYEQSVGMTRTNSAEGRFLLGDGRFRGIFLLSTYGFFTLLPPGEGTWSYRPLGPDKAELILQGNAPSGTKTLPFLTADSGTMIETGPRILTRTGEFLRKRTTDLSRQINASNRTFIRPGGVAIAGFVVTEKTNRVLIRAVGPGLAVFGVQAPLLRPVLRLSAGERPIAENIGWNADGGAELLRRSADFVGAFPLAETAADCALMVAIPAGAYTAQGLRASATAGGEVLGEIYLLRQSAADRRGRRRRTRRTPQRHGGGCGRRPPPGRSRRAVTSRHPGLWRG